MNEDFFLYKKRLIAFVLLLGYAYMHVKLTGVYVDASLDKLTDFSVRLPFGQRMLVPLLVNSLRNILPISLDQLYFLIEWLFISLFYFALLALLQQEFSRQQAQVLSWLFILLLPLVTVINYRFTTYGVATFFFPYDTPSLLFMTLGFLLCLRSQWLYFIPLIFIATINRESSLLLVLMIPALHWEKLHSVYKQIILAALTYLLARWLVLFSLKGISGPLLEVFFRYSQHTHFEVNLYWLLNAQHILLFMFCFAALPLFWFAFYDYIPIRYRPLRYVALFYFLCLMIVGNFIEVRIFSELLILLYLPVCVGLKRWLGELQPIMPKVNSGLVFYIDRYAILSILMLVVVCRQSLNQLILWGAQI